MQAREVPVKRIASMGLAVAAIIAIVISVVMWWLHARMLAPGGDRMSKPYEFTQPGTGEQITPQLNMAPAGLQSAPQPDLAAYRAEKERLLKSAEWVDASKGIARIPIEDAMALLASRPSGASEASR